MEPQVLAPLLFFSIVASSLASDLLPPPLLGVAPQDEEYYSSSVIACRDGSKSFGRDRLNDGFCDCPDGTDEPGTSACPESRFYCRNIGYAPRFLFSSRVNDHICDCCDGSDEYDGQTTCANTCKNNGNLLDRPGNFEKGRRTSKINDVQERRKTIELEDLFQHLKELKIAVMVELLVAASMITCCLFHWRKRLRRRRYSLRN